MIRFCFAVLSFCILTGFTFIGNEVTIDSDCVTLHDIYPDAGMQDNVYCGLDYGQEKIVNKQMTEYLIEKYGIKNAVPTEIVFRRKGNLLTEDRLRADLQNRLAIMYGGMDITVDKIRMGREYYLPDNMQYKIIIPQNRFGNISVTLDNGVKRYTYSVTITANKEMLVATMPINRGESIEGKVAMMKTDLAKVRGIPITETAGYIARTTIAAGRPVTDALVDRKPDAVKDSPVTVIFKHKGKDQKDDGKLVTGKLLEDAYKGKIVRVENSAGGKILLGEYTGDQKVLVNAE